MKTQTQLFKSKGFAPLFRLRSDHKVVGLSDGRHGRLILRKEDWNMIIQGIGEEVASIFSFRN